LPEENRWADTEEGRERLARLQNAIDAWKRNRYDVSDLEAYIASPELDPVELEIRVEAVMERINKRWHRELEAFEAMSSPDADPEERRKFLMRKVKEIKEKRGEQPEPSETSKCPTCGRKVKSQWKSCPFCRSSLVEPRPQTEAPKPPAPATSADRCPECRGRVGPRDRKCPTCGHRLKPWFSF
jgi:hypothetical protein